LKNKKVDVFWDTV